MLKDDLGTRMKEFYEKPAQTKLTRRTPVAIRIDGKAFHTFTQGFNKPFDKVLMQSMQETMLYLCKKIQGCVFGYTQSDEITLILIDYQKFTTSAWFDYEVQKLCSISASMATMAFNQFFAVNVSAYTYGISTLDWNTYETLYKTYNIAKDEGAMFDARCFNIPKEEVANLIYWRQVDATRNSIQMVGQANFSQKELDGKTCNDIQDMLMLQKNINWNDFSVDCKRGSACIYTDNGWTVDKEMPIIRGENRNYIERHIYVGE